MKTTNASLASGDQIILGAAESEMITVEKKCLIFCLNESCKDLSASNIFPFDVRKADFIDESCTHYVVDPDANMSLEVMCALALKIPFVDRSFVEDLCRSLYPEANPEKFQRFKGMKIPLCVLKSVNIMDAGLDDITANYLRRLGASISTTRRDNYKNILLDDRFDVLASAIQIGDMGQLDVLIEKPASPVIVPGAHQSTESIVVPDSQDTLNMPNIEKISPALAEQDVEKENRFSRQRNQRPVSSDSDVKMVSSFANLYRPNRPEPVQNSNSGPNFKKFKKSLPGDRKTTDCIGIADMKPYKGVMESGGVNLSKSEAWLVGDDVTTPKSAAKRLKLDQPASAMAVEPPKFRSSFFNEGLQFE